MSQPMTVVNKLLLKLLSKRWPICCLLFFGAASCGTGVAVDYNKNLVADSIAQVELAHRVFAQLQLLQPMIRSGDLITRTGNDFTSESLRNFNQRDQTFSHCGIASIENDTVFIYHALGGEFNPDQKIRRDALQIFGEAYGNRGIGIFRYNFSPTQINSFVFIAKKWFQNGVMFDMKFDLKTDDRLYCAEYVYKALLVASANKISINTSRVKDFEFVGVDDLYLQPQCIEVKRILYK